MSAGKQLQSTPDMAIPPGNKLLEVLDEFGMSQAELAMRTGRTLKTINEIIKGKAAITPETALQLERVLGEPASLWNGLEGGYREALARKDELQHLKQHIPWLCETPVHEMSKLGWIEKHRSKVEQLQEVLRFFGVASPDQWRAVWTGKRVSFRQSDAFESAPGAVAAWLRKGELDAQSIACQPYNEGRFLEALSHIRSLTNEAPDIFIPEVRRLCADSGVAMVFVPPLPKLRVSGATRWLSPKKAIIQLSLRYKTDDQLWFTFFHESCHVLKHGKREVFLEGKRSNNPEVLLEGNGPDSAKEKEADRFAQNQLIPLTAYREFLQSQKKPLSKLSIQRFADDIGIAAGIVVGRLQHDGKLPHSHCNGLKRRFDWNQWTNILEERT